MDIPNEHINILTGKSYKNNNLFLLHQSYINNRFKSNKWGTFSQIRSSGYKIRRGERSSVVINVPMLFDSNEKRYFKVRLFNEDQCFKLKKID